MSKRNVMMKATVVLLLFVFTASDIIAQIEPAKTVGDKLPAMHLANVYNYENKSIDFPSASNEHVILDFWASWCGSCINEFSKVDSINRKMDGRLSIIPVTYEDKKTVDRTLKEYKKHRGIDLFSIYSDSLLRAAFPYKYLPHYVWINNQGTVVAITDNKALSKENIARFLNNEPVRVTLKKDSVINIDMRKPLFATNQVSPSGHILRQSANAVFTSYIPGVSPGLTLEKEFVCFYNITIRQMLGLSLSDFRLNFMDISRFVLEGFTTEADSFAVGVFRKENYQKFRTMYQPYQYTFEMVFKDSLLTNEEKCARVSVMLNDYLKDMGIRGTKVVRKQRVLALTDVGVNRDSIKSKFAKEGEFITDRSVSMRKKRIGVFVDKFGTYMPNPGKYPIIDQSGLGNLEIDLNFKADLSSVESINQGLLKYGLQLKETDMDQEMILLVKQTK